MGINIDQEIAGVEFLRYLKEIYTQHELGFSIRPEKSRIDNVTLDDFRKGVKAVDRLCMQWYGYHMTSSTLAQAVDCFQVMDYAGGLAHFSHSLTDEARKSENDPTINTIADLFLKSYGDLMRECKRGEIELPYFYSDPSNINLFFVKQIVFGYTFHVLMHIESDQKEGRGPNYQGDEKCALGGSRMLVMQDRNIEQRLSVLMTTFMVAFQAFQRVGDVPRITKTFMAAALIGLAAARQQACKENVEVINDMLASKSFQSAKPEEVMDWSLKCFSALLMLTNTGDIDTSPLDKFFLEMQEIEIDQVSNIFRQVFA
jgi:hypothetical protein